MKNLYRYSPVLVFFVAAALCGVGTLDASNHCPTPLVIDIDADGWIMTTTPSVDFDLDADGILDRVGWLSGDGEAFLALDLNRSGVIENGSELFGSGTMMPDGQLATHGFEALAVYDRTDLGGNEDGWISKADRIWSQLRIWIDVDGDAITDRHELKSIGWTKIIAIDLDFEVTPDPMDGAGNFHFLRSTVHKKTKHFGVEGYEEGIIDDVWFQSDYASYDHKHSD